jgi:hypothetical protein
MLQQVPLIELELNPAKVTEKDSTGGNSRRQRSLKRNRADDHSDEPVSKRQRQDGESYTLSESKTSASTKSDSAKSSVVLDNSARLRKGRQCTRSSLDGTPPVFRRSSRPKRPPQRFQ